MDSINIVIVDVTLDSTVLDESVVCDVSCESSVLEEESDVCDVTLDSTLVADGSSVYDVILDTRCDLNSTLTNQDYQELPLSHSTPTRKPHSADSGKTLHDWQHTYYSFCT